MQKLPGGELKTIFSEVLDKIKSRFEVVDVESALFSSYYKLPKKADHKDPFDRMLIWQAINYDYTLIFIDDGLKLLF